MLKITALQYVSLSEINKIYPDFTFEESEKNPEELKRILDEFGLDTSVPWDTQVGLTHRNKLNEVVNTPRWVGNEKLTPEWLNSGFASKEAKDKASGSRLVTDLYRLKGMIELE